jgi:phosphatidylglycerol---prolipoprotein diacylglyceryl transferase
MEFPVQFKMGNISLSAHLLLETLAFMLGYRYFLYLRKHQKDTISDDHRVWIFIGAALGAFLFSRIIGAMESPSSFINSKHPLLYLFASKTIVGGLLGGLLGVETVKFIIGEKSSSGDLFTYPLILSIIIGRLGCFFNGIFESTYGLETGWITGMDLGDGKLRHPVALYEIAFMTLLWVLLKSAEKKTNFINGFRFKGFMISYLMFRFFLEYLKPHEIIFTSLSTIQIACLAGIFYYRKTIIKLIFKPAEIIAYG